MTPVTRSLSAVALSLVAGLTVMAAPALADGPCGANYTGKAACAINGVSTTANGSILAANETDFYAFHAAANTRLNITITDEEDATCSTNGPTSCGMLGDGLYDASGNWQAGTVAGAYETGSSAPQSGVSAPYSYSYIVPAAGTYYVEVAGEMTADANNNPLATPYQLQVSASPGVVWPYGAKPTPTPTPRPCVVPLFANATLTTVKQRITAAHCAVGRVQWVYSKRVLSGRVITLSPSPGGHLANNARVNITVSKGSRRGKS